MTKAAEPLVVRARASNGPPGFGQALRIEPRRTALVVIDVQRYFVEALPFAAMGRIVGPTSRLLAIARAADMLVVHVRTAFQPDMSDAGRVGSRTREMLSSTRSGLVDGTPGAEIVPALEPRPDELVIVKKAFSGFAATTLHQLLAAHDIDTLLFAGGTTTVCVESTLRDAMFLGYNCVLLSDCTADLNDALHDSALARVDLFFGWVCSSTELAAGLTAASSA